MGGSVVGKGNIFLYLSQLSLASTKMLPVRVVASHEMLLVRMNVNILTSPTGRPHEAKNDAYNKSGAHKRDPEPLHGKLGSSQAKDPGGVYRSNRISREVSAPCSELLSYAPMSATNLLRLAAHLSRWLEAQALGIEQFSAERIAEFLAVRRERRSHFFTERALAPILLYFENAGLLSRSAIVVVPGGAADQLLSSYVQYLQRERCLTAGCVQHYSAIARQFLRWRFGEDQVIDITALKASEVTSFSLYASARYSTGTAKLVVTAMRSFLRYLYLQEKVPVDLTGALPAIAGWRLTGLPKALTASQVHRLLRACDRRRHVGRRDYAVLLLLTRLGLRAGEVSALELEDVDWRHGEILVHGKGKRKERLPLPDDVDNALASYLRLSCISFDLI